MAATISCNQLSNSISETFNPDSSKVAKNEPVEKKDSWSVTMDTVIESHSVSVKINGAGSGDVSVTLNSKAEAGFLKDAATLSAAEQALQSLPAFAGKTVYLYQHLHFFSDGRILATVQNPENPEYVDSYVYQKGRWSEPSPVQLSVRDNVKKSLISLDDVKFASVADIYKNYTEKAAGVQGSPALTHIYLFILNNRPEWYPQRVNGSRERYRISFKRDGSLDRFYRE